MWIIIWLYILCWLFFSIDSKLLWDGWDDCSIDFLYKLLLIVWVVCTWIGIVKSWELFFVWAWAYLIAIILKFYINKKYRLYLWH